MEIDFRKFNLQNIAASDPFEAKVIDFLKEWVSDTTTVEVQTSGSTGTPKVLSVEKSKMLNSAQLTCDFLNIHAGNSALLCLPLEYISGKMMVVRAMERKMVLTVTQPSLHPLEKLNKKIDFCAMTPLQVENSLDKIQLVSKLIIGGAAVSEPLKVKITTALNSKKAATKIYETYGMSETLSHIALKEIYPEQDEYFTLFEGIEISADERGCLQIKAPKLSAETLQTNDLVELKDPQRFRFLGRVDNIINSGGVKIFPEQIENLAKVKIEREIIFIGIPDSFYGQKLVAVVEGNFCENVKQQIFQLPFINSAHKPKAIIFFNKLPRTPNGKIDRVKLRTMTPLHEQE